MIAWWTGWVGASRIAWGVALGWALSMVIQRDPVADWQFALATALYAAAIVLTIVAEVRRR